MSRKVDTLFAQPNEFTLRPPPALVGKVRPSRDDVMDAKRRSLRAAAGAVRAILPIVQTLAALGVVPASDRATASVEMARLAVHRLAALMREQCEAAGREYPERAVGARVRCHGPGGQGGTRPPPRATL